MSAKPPSKQAADGAKCHTRRIAAPACAAKSTALREHPRIPGCPSYTGCKVRSHPPPTFLGPPPVDVRGPGGRGRRKLRAHVSERSIVAPPSTAAPPRGPKPVPVGPSVSPPEAWGAAARLREWSRHSNRSRAKAGLEGCGACCTDLLGATYLEGPSFDIADRTATRTSSGVGCSPPFLAKSLASAAM